MRLTVFSFANCVDAFCYPLHVDIGGGLCQGGNRCDRPFDSSFERSRRHPLKEHHYLIEIFFEQLYVMYRACLLRVANRG
jgi:hypothetical protein